MFDGHTALGAAVEHGFTEIVKVLLNASRSSLNGRTAIMHRLAQFEGCTTILLDGGADVNVRSQSRMNTELHFACCKGYTTIVETLITAGEVDDS